METRRVVISGLGIVSSIGLGKEAFWVSSLAGRSGVSRISGFDTEGLGCRIWGRIPAFDAQSYIPPAVLKRSDPVVHFALASAAMALEDSGLGPESLDKERTGVIMGSGLGGILFHESQMERALRSGMGRINPLAVPRTTPNSIASHIAIMFNVSGPAMVISNACASGANAVGEAFRKIRYGEIDAAFAGGSESAVTPFTLAAYDAIGVLSKRNDDPEGASRPFDAGRDGFVLGEGAGVLLLEEYSRAKARGARIYAEVTGYCATSGAYHMVMPRPDGEDAARAMAGALRDAGIAAADVGYINAHGTSTRLNDSVETRAIKAVFGDAARSIPVSSTKSMLGHTIGASGAIEAAVCGLVLERQMIPATLNYRTPDPECDLDYVPVRARSCRVQNVLSNSFGFGSNNACLVFRRYDG